jgi:hypothetical protein
MDKFPKKWLIKLRYNATHLRVIHETLYLLKYLRDQPVTNLGYTLFSVPCPYPLQVAQSRLGEGNHNPWH